MNLLKNRNNVITYTVNKNNYSDLYISVQNGEVIINAPFNMATNQIQKIVEEKRQWILNKINEYDRVSKEKREYTKLDVIKVLGQEYVLAVKYKAIKTPNLSVENDKILVILPNRYKKLENSKLIDMLISKMYDMVSKKEIERSMEKARLMMQMAPEDYEIRRMKGHLAKCVNKRIIINPEVVKYDREVIDYIVLHQFCHLRYKNHTKSFYDMIATYIPNYEEYANQINNFKY